MSEPKGKQLCSQLEKLKTLASDFYRPAGKSSYMNTRSRNVANARNSAQGLKELEQPSCPLTAVNSAAAAGK